MTLFQRLRFKFERITKFEYWPYLVFYFPMFFYGFYLAFRSRSFTYFTSANPSMKYGGIMGESKKKVLDLIDKKYLPKSILIKHPADIEQIRVKLAERGFGYPIIVKPNIGERGALVELIDNDQNLWNYFNKTHEDVIAQEFVSFPTEVGVLYYRYPGKSRGNISSVVIKKFLEITGDGISTISSLLEKEVRAFGRLDYLKSKFANELPHILKAGEKMLLEPIGNHCRGTTFFNGNHLINQQLISVFDEIGGHINGFYYGRFDLKVASVDDLYAGKNIKILELNGVSSEPAHIYDPDYKLIRAYKDVAFHMKVIYEIARANRKSGHANDSLLEFIKDLKAHFRRKERRSFPA